MRDSPRSSCYPWDIEQPFVLLYCTYFKSKHSNLKESYNYYISYDWYANFLKKYLIGGVN
jgi:hypothetical protein